MFLNHFLLRQYPMPLTLNSVKTLKIDIDIVPLGDEKTSFDISRLSKLLSTSSSLKQLYVVARVRTMNTPYAEISNRMLRVKVMQFHLRPLRSISRLTEVCPGVVAPSSGCLLRTVLFWFKIVSLDGLDNPRRRIMLPVRGKN